MRTKRFFLFGLPAVLLAVSVSLAMGLVLTGCGGDDGDGDGDGGVQLPANLQNTKWEGAQFTLTFGTTTVTRSGDETVYTVASAVENGAIVLNDPSGGIMNLCESYSISSDGNALTILAGNSSLTFTKVTP